MTENELEFFGRLVAALPDHYVFPQVAMTALLEAASSDKKKSHGDRLRIAQQRADYVVCKIATWLRSSSWTIGRTRPPRINCAIHALSRPVSEQSGFSPEPSPLPM